MWPSSNGTVADAMQGTTLFTDPNETHSLNHRQIGSVVNSLTTVFGTTPGTNLFGNYSAGQLPLPQQGGTLGSVITKGTINNGILGSQMATGGTFTAPTISGAGTNAGTVSGGMYGTATWQGGSVNNASLGTNQITSGTISSAVIGTSNIIAIGKSIFSATDIATGGTFGAGTMNVCAGTIVIVNPSQLLITGNMDAYNGAGAVSYQSYLYQGTTQLALGAFVTTAGANNRAGAGASYTGSFSAGTYTFYLAANNPINGTSITVGNIGLSILAIPG